MKHYLSNNEMIIGLVIILSIMVVFYFFRSISYKKEYEKIRSFSYNLPIDGIYFYDYYLKALINKNTGEIIYTDMYFLETLGRHKEHIHAMYCGRWKEECICDGEAR